MAPTLTQLAQLDLAAMSLDAGVSLFSSPRVSASIDDPENDQVRLDVEVVASSAAFTDMPTASSALQAEGPAQLVLPSLPPGSYKWQARARDASGFPSPWVPYASGGVAFTILPNPVMGAVLIQSGVAAFNSSTVSLIINASSPVTPITMALSNDGVTFSGDEPLSSPRAGWALVPGDGTRSVFVRLTDAASNSLVVNDSIIIDTVPPLLSNVTLNSGAAATNAGSATLSFVTSDPGSGVVAFEASNDGTTFTSVSIPSSWPLTPGDGVKTVTVRVRDGAGNTTTATNTILRDGTPPTLSSVSINGGAGYTSSAAVQVTISASDGAGSGLAQVCFSGQVTTLGCFPYGSGGPYAVTLFGTDSPKVVSVTVVDVAGNTSNPAGDGIVLDTTAPVLTSVSLSAGAAFTRIASITATLAGASDTNLSQMEFSFNGGTSYEAPIAYAASPSITLPAPDGLKTVHVRVIDAAGLRSPARFDDITLDTAPPTVAISAPRGSNQTTAPVTLTAGPDLSGVVRMCLKVTAVATAVVPPTGPTDPCFVAFAASTTVTVSTGGVGDKRVHAWVQDGAGHISTVSTTDVFYDLTAPTAPTLTSVLAGNHGLLVSWNAASDGSGVGVSEYEVGLSKTAGGPYVFQGVGAGAAGFVQASNDITWFLVVRAKDHAGNVSGNSSQSSGLPYFPWEHQQREPSGVSFNDLEVVDAGTSARWIAAGDFGALYSSDDNLTTWTRRDALSDLRLFGVSKAAGALYAFGEGGHLARSDDVGASFTEETTPAQLSATTIGDVGVVGTGATTVTLAAVAFSGDIARQVITNGTRGPWAHVGRPTTNALRGLARCSGAPAGTACAGATSQVSLAVGNAGTLLRSNDSGATWAPVPLGTLAVDYASRNFSSVVSRPNSNEFYISVNNVSASFPGLLIYDAQLNSLVTAGATWNGPFTQVRLSEDGTHVFVLGASLHRFAVGSPGSPTPFGLSGVYTAVAGLTSTGVSLVGQGGVYTRGFSGGGTSLNPGVANSFNAIAMQAGVSANAWTVGTSGMIRFTTDTGTTWTTASAGTTASLRSVAMVNTVGNTPYVIAVGTGTTIARKRGAGAWGVQTHTLGSTNTLLDVSCNAPSTTLNTIHCVVVGTSGVVATLSQDISTGDGTWVMQPTPQATGVEYRAVTRIHVSGTNYRVIAAGLSGRAIRWTGSEWTEWETIPGSPTINDLATRHGAGTETMACGNAGAVRYTTDYGVTWTSHNVPGFTAVDFTSCANLPGTNDWILVGSNGTMVKGTRSGGTFSWQTLPSVTGQLLSGVATGAGSTDRVYVAGGAGTVLFSATGGE